MSELLDKQVNAQKEKTQITQAPASPRKKCLMKMKETRIRKRRVRKNIHRRKPFIMPIHKTGENNLHQLWENNCGYNEGTICLVNG